MAKNTAFPTEPGVWLSLIWVQLELRMPQLLQQQDSGKCGEAERMAQRIA